MVAALAVLGLASPALAHDDGGHGHGHRGHATVKMYDDCEPESFNAALGAGTCVGNGHTTLQQALAEFGRRGKVHEWFFEPRFLHLREGAVITAVNKGGEDHTFTRVAKYGGGCIDLLNALPGGRKQTPVPECKGDWQKTLVEQGEKKDFTVHDANRDHVERYECLLHPWMKTTVIVSGSKHH
jgi:plastocyanin